MNNVFLKKDKIQAAGRWNAHNYNHKAVDSLIIKSRITSKDEHRIVSRTMAWKEKHFL